MFIAINISWITHCKCLGVGIGVGVDVGASVVITTQKHVLRAELRNVVARFEQLTHMHYWQRFSYETLLFSWARLRLCIRPLVELWI